MSAIPANERRVGLIGPLLLLLLLVGLSWAAGDRMLRLEFSLYDLVQRELPPDPSGQVLVVTAAGTSPSLWTDERLPRAIDALAAAGAAVIVPTQAPPANTGLPDLEQLAELLDLEKRAGPGRGEARDLDALKTQLDGFRVQAERQAAVQAALARSGRAVLPLPAENPRDPADTDNAECARLALATVAEDDERLAAIRPARELLASGSPYCQGLAGGGYAGFRPDPDGLVRESALLVRSGDRVYPTLALAAVAAAVPGQPLRLAADGELTLGERRLPTGPGQVILNRYYGRAAGAEPFQLISLDALLAGELPPAELANRVVLIGQPGADAGLRTPVDEAMPVTLLVATSISNLLQADYTLRPAWCAWSELALLVALTALFLALVPGMSLNAAALAAVFLGTMLITTELYLLLAHGIWVQLGTATVFSALGIAAIAGLRYLRLGSTLAPAGPQPAMAMLSNEDELDLAFSVLRQQAPNDDTKERLYSIAVTHGRRREFAKAERVLRYLASIDPDYRGVQDKLKKLSGARQAEAPENRSEPEAPVPASVQKRRVSEGRRLGRYELDKVLGRGAMATVYLGRDPKINRKVAIKTIALAEEFSEEDLQAAKSQFLREAESAGRLNHPNIIAIYDVDEDADVAYLAMEYFEGESLNHHAQAGTLLPPQWVLELGARAAEALHYAHAQKVVHRDIKPANIMYNAAADELKLTDFGIARLTDTSRTKTGIILGTPSYMSPEQLSGAPVTGQSDLYSLGITLYHLLTGAPPFRADSIPKLMDKIVNERHTPLTELRDDLPPCVDAIFERALAKDPADRFANGRAMALALRECCSSFTA